MISSTDIGNGIAGAFALARNEKSWSERMNMSADAVFRSFWAMLLALPPHIVAVEGARRLAIESEAISIPAVSPGVWAASQSVLFVLMWAAELVVLVTLARRRNAGWRISPLIIGYNWSVFVARLGLGLTTGLALISGVAALAEFSMVLVAALSIWLQWGVIRRTLETSVAGTIGVIALLRIVALIVSLFASVFLTSVGIIPQPAAG